jgi:hypothetical protein
MLPRARADDGAHALLIRAIRAIARATARAILMRVRSFILILILLSLAADYAGFIFVFASPLRHFTADYYFDYATIDARI